MKRLKVERGGWKVNANRRMEEFRLTKLFELRLFFHSCCLLLFIVAQVYRKDCIINLDSEILYVVFNYIYI